MSSTSSRAMETDQSWLPQVGLDYARVGAHLGRRPLGDLLAVVEDTVKADPCSETSITTFMSCSIRQDRQLQLVAQLAHELGERARLLRVHARRRLVEQQQLRVGRERARDLDAALVAVRRELDRRAGRTAARLEPGRTRCSSRAPARGPRAPRGGPVAWRKIEPNSPARMRVWRPIMTFSTALIAPNSRMFWNVRATPRPTESRYRAAWLG